MTRVRPPAMAGTFYPADARELAATVDGFLAQVAAPTAQPGPPLALIAPHAGYVYSGPVAASAYAQLVPWCRHFHRVLLVGVPHRAHVRGLALSSAAAWDTPLGRVPVDCDGVAALLALRGVEIDDRAHAQEHSLEVHLPFLQRVLADGWQLLPVIAGGPDTKVLADALEPWWGVDHTLVVVSTDLSHYHPHEAAQVIDRATAAAIVATNWETLEGNQACGASGVRVALELARRHHSSVHLLDLRTSADTAGTAERVVGYGSFAVR